MAHVQLHGALIHDWDAFHDQSAAAFGFPAFYGRNMNAWMDCLHYVREGDGMSRFVLGPEEVLVIEVLDTGTFKRQAPEIFDMLVECVALINRGQAEAGQLPALQILFR